MNKVSDVITIKWYVITPLKLAHLFQYISIFQHNPWAHWHIRPNFKPVQDPRGRNRVLAFATIQERRFPAHYWAIRDLPSATSVAQTYDYVPLLQVLTEMSNRDISWGEMRPVWWADNFTTFMCRMHKNSWSLKHPGALRDCRGLSRDSFT